MGVLKSRDSQPWRKEAPGRLRRPAPRTLLRALLPALLLAAAFVAGGAPGVILGFVAALLVLDRMLDHAIGFSGWGMLDAERSFRRLARQRRRTALGRRLHHLPPDGDRLAYLADDTGWAAVAGRRAIGVQTIAVESIVGTVDGHKSVAFDGSFRPPRWSRGRWTLMYLAARAGTRLPPISVYRVGGDHFVRDGHHRVSVARALGTGAIDAEVVELRPAAGHGEPDPRPAVYSPRLRPTTGRYS
jgi:hypothetical protein